MSRSVRLRGGKSIATAGYAHYRCQAGHRMTGQLAEDGMDKAMTDRIEQQVRQAFPQSAIARVQVLQYGDDPEVEPGQAAVRVFFNWPGQAEGGQASPKTVHQFCNASAAALGVLRDGLPDVIGWAEFRPEGEGRPARAGGLSYRIANRGRPSPRDEAEDRTPVMVWLGAADLASVDTLITAGIVTSRAEGLRWALSRLREHPADARLQQQADENDDPTTQ